MPVPQGAERNMQGHQPQRWCDARDQMKDGSSSSSSSGGGALPGRDRQWLNFTLPEMTVLVRQCSGVQLNLGKILACPAACMCKVVSQYVCAWGLDSGCRHMSRRSVQLHMHTPQSTLHVTRCNSSPPYSCRYWRQAQQCCFAACCSLTITQHSSW
jgi:hypothetical protein